MEEFYNRHYISLRSDNAVIDTWSDGPRPEKDTISAICINEHGGYQFRLYPDGEENPAIYDANGIPLYKWDGEQVAARTAEEIEAEKSTLFIPSFPEQNRSEVHTIANLSDTLDTLLISMLEGDD